MTVDPNTLPINEATEFTFRPVRSLKEMVAVSRVRYETYGRTNGVASFLEPRAELGLDLDAYDLHSHHFGLCARTPGAGEAIVGSLRVSGEAPGPLADLVRAIAARSASLAARVGGERTAPLPLLSYLEQAPALRVAYDRFVRAGERLAEPGRLAIHPHVRRASARLGLRLSSFVMCCAKAAGWYPLGLDRVLMDCDVSLLPLYEPFGFLPIEGGEARYQPTLGFTIVALQATPGSLPQHLRPLVRRLAGQLTGDGEAVLDRAEPAFAAARRSRPGVGLGAATSFRPATATAA